MDITAQAGILDWDSTNDITCRLNSFPVDHYGDILFQRPIL